MEGEERMSVYLPNESDGHRLDRMDAADNFRVPLFVLTRRERPSTRSSRITGGKQLAQGISSALQHFGRFHRQQRHATSLQAPDYPDHFCS